MIHQTPWFERKFDFNFPAGYFPIIVERLKGTFPQIESLERKETEARLSHKMEGAWSVKEHIGHLYDLEELWFGRIEDFLSGKETLRAADLNNTRTHEADHNKRKMKDLVHQFHLERTKLIEKVRDLDESTVLITSLHPRLKTPMRLIDSLFFVAEHDDHHLAKVSSLLG